MFIHTRVLRYASSTIYSHRGRRLPLSTAASAASGQWGIADILPICVGARSLSETQQAHTLAIVHGLLPRSVSVSAALILSYATYNSDYTILHSLFVRSAPFSRSSFLHNTLIRACSFLVKNGLHKDGIGGQINGILWYNDLLMSDYPIRPDDYTFPFVLKLCADFVLVKKGLELHGSLIKVGFDYDVFVNNTLIRFYGSWGNLMSARNVFDEMPQKDLISWNTVICMFSDHDLWLDSVGFFKNMVLMSENKPNVVSVVSILPVCAKLEDERLVRLIHCYTIKAGLDGELRIGNALIDAYGKCGNFEALDGVFDEMIEINEVSWNAVIGSYACKGFNIDAFDSFRMMLSSGVRLNSVTLATMLPTLVELDCFNKGKELHGFSLKMGLDTDVFAANALMDLYGKWRRFTEASNMFHKMDVKNIVSWNTMISNSAQNGHEMNALKHVREMQSHGELPNSITLTNVLPACARLNSVCHGKEIHARAIRFESALGIFVSNALTDMYAKCGYLDLAQRVFHISVRDEVSYNILIIGFSQTSQSLNSVNLFKEMETFGLKQNTVSYMGVISACANVSAINEGKQVHSFAVRRYFHEHLFVANALLDLYIKCGRIDVSMKVFSEIPHKDTTSWNTMILGFGMLGELDAAVKLFEAMKEDEVEYDSVSYIAVLSACSHGGLVEMGKAYFNEMLARNIKPSEMHYACMVDLLGRSGLMEEAVLLINSLLIEPGVHVWGALLGASRVHGHMELGCWAAEHLLELNPNHSGYYVLLSNMYAEAGRWDEADRIRKLMQVRSVKKNPGCSWFQGQGQIHELVSGIGSKCSSFQHGTHMMNNLERRDKITRSS